MSLEERITQEVRGLQGLNLEALRAEWRCRYGAPPRLRSPDLLARMLSWRIQAEALGGLDSDLARRLRRGSGLTRPRSELSPGSQLTREWKGRAHLVEVTEDGFRYGGMTYRSLSKVAGVITGGKWNGRRFFGLDQEPT